MIFILQRKHPIIVLTSKEKKACVEKIHAFFINCCTIRVKYAKITMLWSKIVVWLFDDLAGDNII